MDCEENGQYVYGFIPVGMPREEFVFNGTECVIDSFGANFKSDGRTTRLLVA